MIQDNEKVNTLTKRDLDNRSADADVSQYE